MPRRTEAPEVLTLRQSDRYDWAYSGESLEAARIAARRPGTVLYTQVDGEKDRIYSRGEHYVNRTGRYLVIVWKKKPLKLGNRTRSVPWAQSAMRE